MVSIDLPLEYIIGIGILILALAGAALFFGMYWLEMRDKNKELDVFLTARKKHLPIISLIDLAGRLYLFVGEKHKPQDIKYKNDTFGLIIDSAQASKKPRSSLQDGTPLIFYGINFHFPLDPNGARGIVQLIHNIREEYPQLNFILDDIAIMELLTKSGDDLYNDVQEVLYRYPQEKEPEDIIQTAKRHLFSRKKATTQEPTEVYTAEQIVGIFEEIKGRMASWNVKSGYINMKEAISLLPIATTSRDMLAVETVTKIATQNDMNKDLKWWQEMATPFLYVVGAMVVGFMVIMALRN